MGRYNSMKNLELKFLGMVNAARYCGIYRNETEELEKTAKKVARCRNVHPRPIDYSGVEKDGLEPFLEMTLGGAAIE